MAPKDNKEEAVPPTTTTATTTSMGNNNNGESNSLKTDTAGTAATSNKATTTTNTSITPVPFSALFQYAKTPDLVIFALGCVFCVLSSATMPSINIIFGDVIDAVAEPLDVETLVNRGVRAMAVIGVYGFFTFFIAFWCCGTAAGNIANGWRMQYLEGLLLQDMSFFDNTEQGSLTLMMSDSAMAIQTGLSEKFAQMLQGIFQFVFGFGIAFWFGPKLAGVLLACVPLLGLIIYAMFMWGSEDGLFGKEAYETASTIANEAMVNIRTVASLNAEPIMSKRYDAQLVHSEQSSIRQGTRNAVLTGSLFLVIFVMYGLGFWYGATLIADSIDEAMVAHPPPSNILDVNNSWYPIIQIGCADYLDNDDIDVLEVCACNLPWDIIIDDADSGVQDSPNCGCGYEQTAGGELGASVLSGCVSGGRIIMVFFSILIGGFSAGQIGPGFKAMSESRVAAARMMAVINRVPTIGDGDTDEDEDDNNNNNNNNNTQQFDKNAKPPKQRLKRENVRGKIVLENVHFQYTKLQQQQQQQQQEQSQQDGFENLEEHVTNIVFAGCNLTIEAGQTVALVGESGCGKSTIAKLVQRFYDPTAGRILLDDTDLKHINVRDLRSCTGIVSQEPLLFDTTIEENIRYGKPDATFEEIVKAAESANAHDFIMTFPEGYKTLVGPKGGKLSGGQKQRVAIARAILRDPPILILDEATSALDNKSEKLVQLALDRLIHSQEGDGPSRSRTIIVIAHRLSTIRNADKIVVLGSTEGTSTAVSGSVVLEEGNHDELMKLEKGFYRALVGAGAAHNSTAIVDDIDAIEDDTATSEKSFKDKVDAAERRSTKSELSNDQKEETGGLLGGLFGGKDDSKEQEKKQLAENRARVWNYTRPEMTWIVFGSAASICKGAIMPALSIAFSRMIIVWYDSDTDFIVERSLEYSYIFYALAVATMLFEAVQKGIFEMIGERLTKRLRADLFRSILRKDIGWFENEENAIGGLASRLSTDVKMVRLVAGQSLAATLESCSALATGIIISAQASWEIFLIMLAMVPALGTAEALQFVALKSSEGSIRDQLSQSTDKLHEAISGIREVQSFSLQRIVIDSIERRIIETITPATKKAAIIKGLMMGMIQLIQFLVYAFAFWFGGQMISKGRIEFDDFLQALWAMAFAASGLGQAALFGGDAAKASAAVTSIFKTLDFTPKIDSAPWENGGVADKKSNVAIERQIPNTVLQDGKSELEKVNFAYPSRKTAKIFDQIDLQIPTGKVVALVGSSGSGKSTVVQLLERFYDPISFKEERKDGKDVVEVVVDDGALKNDDGIVRIGEKDIREQDIRWLRQNMGLVSQEPVLFNQSIYENIAMGKENCTKDEIFAAARHANAYDFIMNLEEGFDTMVGMGGGKISGGQKQRVAIARALVGNPKILILDEATSALDNESEKIVQQSLDQIVKESGGYRTTIVIAHRLSTIQNADCICVLENQGDGSRVVEMGTHDELMALGKKYKALVQAYES